MEVDKRKFRLLEMARIKLEALEAGGVDSWVGYNPALQDIWRQEKLGQQRRHLIEDIEAVFSEAAYEPSERGAGIGFRSCLQEDVIDVLEAHGVIFKGEKP